MFATFNCEICYRAKLAAARDVITPNQAGTVFAVEFEGNYNGQALFDLLRKASKVLCPHAHEVDTDEVREVLDTDGNSIPRGRCAGKQK